MCDVPEVGWAHASSGEPALFPWRRMLTADSTKCKSKGETLEPWEKAAEKVHGSSDLVARWAAFVLLALRTISLTVVATYSTCASLMAG